MVKRIFCGLCLLLLFIGCGVKKKIVYSPIYESKRNYVKLMKTVDAKTGEPLEATYEHPQQLAEEKLRHWLSVIQFEHYQWSTFGLDDNWIKGRVFESQAINELAPSLADAFSKATASDVIQFGIVGQNGDTIGKMWVKDNQWVCELNRINGYNYQGKDAGRLDNLDWRLVEASGLKVEKNWTEKSFTVAINLQAEPGELQESKPPMKEKDAANSRQTTDQKLRQLKQWLDDGLITQEQYQQKVDSLLKDF